MHVLSVFLICPSSQNMYVSFICQSSQKHGTIIKHFYQCSVCEINVMCQACHTSFSEDFTSSGKRSSGRNVVKEFTTQQENKQNCNHKDAATFRLCDDLTYFKQSFHRNSNNPYNPCCVAKKSEECVMNLLWGN
jgi:hypothetical protein